MSPAASNATAFGPLNEVRDVLSPVVPFVPSVMTTCPAASILYTTWAVESVAHNAPSGPMWALCAVPNSPASPHCFTGCPSRENIRKWGAVRTSTMTEPLPSGTTDEVLPPQAWPAGSCAHEAVTSYRSKRLPSADCALKIGRAHV